MIDSSVLIRNERYKSWATNLTRLGSGLIAYGFADLYINLELKFTLAPPLLTGTLLCWFGWKFLGLLEVEKCMIPISATVAELAPSIGGLLIALVAWIVYRHEAAKVAAQRQARGDVVGEPEA